LWAEDISAGKAYTIAEVVKFAQNQAMKLKILGPIVDRVRKKEDLRPIVDEVKEALEIGACPELPPEGEKRIDYNNNISRNPRARSRRTNRNRAAGNIWNC
jgi:hypothetical protein